MNMKNKKEIISDDRRTGDLSDMSGLLLPLAKKMLGKKAFVEADIICAWKDIIGDDMAKFSRPLKIVFGREERNNGTLWIEAASGAFALELQTKSKIVIEKVNTFFGYAAVEKIKIVQNPSIMESTTDTHNSEKKLVTKEEETYIKNLSEEIKTKELSEAIERLGCAIIANNKK